MQETDWVKKSLQHIWYPCSQMKDYESFKPLEVVRAYDSFIELKNGKKIIDAISSWWCKALGHQHPRLKKAIMEQLERFEHVILANTTHETIAALSEKLATLSPSLEKVFYASDGSCAVEIAMKMSLHARKIEGHPHKTRFISLENAYHGETMAALSVSDVGLYREPYRSMMFEPILIQSLPYLSGADDPLWQDCSSHWKIIEKQLEPYRDSATAILVEPIVQGAAGMKMYSPDFLRRLREWATMHDVHFIADEIMTGMGRTGKMLACEHANIEPDIVCIGKGLTSGWLPLSVVLTSNRIYNVFYDDYQTGKSFLHSHTHSGNALAVRVALEVMMIFAEESICQKAQKLGDAMRSAMRDIAETTHRIDNVRGVGAIVAADLISNDPDRRLGFEVYQKAVEMGALLRPIGNTIYWLPPLTMQMDTLCELHNITKKAILAV